MALSSGVQKDPRRVAMRMEALLPISSQDLLFITITRTQEYKELREGRRLLPTLRARPERKIAVKMFLAAKNSNSRRGVEERYYDSIGNDKSRITEIADRRRRFRFEEIEFENLSGVLSIFLLQAMPFERNFVSMVYFLFNLTKHSICGIRKSSNMSTSIVLRISIVIFLVSVF